MNRILLHLWWHRFRFFLLFVPAVAAASVFFIWLNNSAQGLPFNLRETVLIASGAALLFLIGLGATIARNVIEGAEHGRWSEEYPSYTVRLGSAIDSYSRYCAEKYRDRTKARINGNDGEQIFNVANDVKLMRSILETQKEFWLFDGKGPVHPNWQVKIVRLDRK